MAINDPLEVTYNKKRQKFYVKQGREIFFDDDRLLIEFDTSKECVAWIVENFPDKLIFFEEQTDVMQ